MPMVGREGLAISEYGAGRLLSNCTSSERKRVSNSAWVIADYGNGHDGILKLCGLTGVFIERLETMYLTKIFCRVAKPATVVVGQARKKTTHVERRIKYCA